MYIPGWVFLVAVALLVIYRPEPILRILSPVAVAAFWIVASPFLLLIKIFRIAKSAMERAERFGDRIYARAPKWALIAFPVAVFALPPIFMGFRSRVDGIGTAVLEAVLLTPILFIGGLVMLINKYNARYRARSAARHVEDVRKELLNHGEASES